MERWLTSFFVGAILSLFLPIVPDFFYVSLFALLFILAFINRQTRKYSGLFFGAAWLLFHGACYQNIWQSNHFNDKTLSFKPYTLVGVIKNIPVCQKNICRFNFGVVSWHGNELSQVINLRMRWDEPDVQPKQGQMWQFEVKVKPAHGLANEGGYSFQTWLRRHNIHGSAYVKTKVKPQLINERVSLRQQAFTHYQKQLPNHSLSPLLLALTFGERGGLTKAHWQVLQDTQTQHLIAISGLHIGLVVAGSYLLLSLLVRYFPLAQAIKLFQGHRCVSDNEIAIINGANNKYWLLALSTLIAMLYAYFSGFAIPTIRAIIMIVVFLLMRLLTVNLSVRLWLLLVITVIVLLTPMSLLSMSFWLSIYAVAAIFFIIWRYQSYFHSHSGNLASLAWWLSKLKQLILLQVLLTLIMLPLAVFYSGQVSMIAIVTNLVAVPVMSFIVLPITLLSLITSFFSSAITSYLISFTLLVADKLWRYLNFLTTSDYAVFPLSYSLWLLLVLVVFLYFARLVSQQLMSRWTIAPLVLLLLGISVPMDKSSWQIKVMDVGQGLAVVVEQDHETLLYDTGANYPTGFSMAESVLLPYFRYSGRDTLDWLVVSHDDNDHAGGVKQLSDHLVIDKRLANGTFDMQSAAVFSCLRGQAFQWKNLTISVLWPLTPKGDKNDESCVIKITDGNYSVLLTGDISQRVEKKLLKLSDKSLQADILIAPHHGSKSSSSTAFIKAVQPRIVVFSTGFLNQWRMPNVNVIERYQQQGVKVYNTAENGMLTLDIDHSGINVIRYRQDDSWYWFAN